MHTLDESQKEMAELSALIIHSIAIIENDPSAERYRIHAAAISKACDAIVHLVNDIEELYTE